ncbi:MAG: glutamine amidotransferase [Myxococcota bacterium]|nr:glutamine amidotransferase [Myxococcota bacterium]
MKPLLIIRLGEPPPSVREVQGDFEAWIEEAMQEVIARFDVVNVPAGGSLPDPGTLAGVVITGSASMVSEQADWSEETAAWLKRAVASDLPMLGICYGHQLIAHALGGEVGPNPRGREIGTVSLRLTATDDALLAGLPSEIAVQTSHSEAVLRLPEEAVGLGETDLDPNHVFRIGDRIWGVQFHPEFDQAIMRGYIEARKEALVEEGLVPSVLLGACADSEAATGLLARFGRLVGGFAQP